MPFFSFFKCNRTPRPVSLKASGEALVQYAVVAALIVVACIPAVQPIMDSITKASHQAVTHNQDALVAGDSSETREVGAASEGNDAALAGGAHSGDAGANSEFNDVSLAAQYNYGAGAGFSEDLSDVVDEPPPPPCCEPSGDSGGDSSNNNTNDTVSNTGNGNQNKGEVVILDSNADGG